MRKLSLREVKWLAQGHTASQLNSSNSNPETSVCKAHAFDRCLALIPIDKKPSLLSSPAVEPRSSGGQSYPGTRINGMRQGFPRAGA